MTWNPGGSIPLPPPTPMPTYTLPPQRRESKLAILGAWLIIIGVVVYVGVQNYRSSHDQRIDRAASAVEMEITSRTIVGYVSVTRAMGMGAQLDDNLEKLTKSITDSATGNRQNLMAVAVVGELRGKALALERLNAIDITLKSLPDDSDTAELRKDSKSLRTIYEKSPKDIPAPEQTRLQTQLGWFGKLALVAGMDDASPERHAILVACQRAAVATFAIEIVLLLFFLAGVVLLILAIVKLAIGTLRLNYQPAPNAGSAFIEMFALYLLGFVVIGRTARAMHVESEFAVYGIVSIWIVGCCCWPLVRGLSFKEIRQGLGWMTGRGILAEAALGLVGYLTFIPLLALAVALSALLAKFGHERAVHPIIFEAQNQSRAAMIGLYLLASGFAPVVEETMFRGALFHHMRRAHRWILSAAVTAIIFAAVHPQGWTAIPVLGGIGFAFAGIREWRGNIIASGTAHAVNNAVALSMLFLVLG